jgi:hypothetical protein
MEWDGNLTTEDLKKIAKRSKLLRSNYVSLTEY